jgi:WD40 repeat protein
MVQDCSLHTFSFNGFPLASTRVRHPLYAMAASKDGQMLVSGGASGVLSIHLVHNLELVHEMTISHGPIRSLSFTPDHQYILIGSQDGQFTVVADPLGRLQMLHRVLSRTFLGAL